MALSLRSPAVAGSFYPADAATLENTVQDLLRAADAPATADWPKALIAPHAGYVYSGPVAASAYARLAPARGKVSRVVLLGPAHRVYVRGLALPGADAFATPLGDITLDRQALGRLAALPQVSTLPAAHTLEHALEVQLPFLQAALGEFALVPVVVGAARPEEVAQALDLLWGGEETLVVVSSDLSHYLDYDEAQRIDRATAQSILELSADLHPEQACGSAPLNGLLLAAKRRGLAPQLLDLRNSADTAGDPDRVVGYGAFALFEQAAGGLGDAEGRLMLAHARHAIGEYFGAAGERPSTPDWMNKPGASFVTLKKHGELRGCIGTLEAYRTLQEDLRSNALAAALRDPRFVPLAAEELGVLHIEVSLLSAPQAMSCRDEDDAILQLRPGIDGIVMQYRRHRATFLPQVWEVLSQPGEFLAQLKRKAGLAPGFWAEELELSRYTVSQWSEA